MTKIWIAAVCLLLQISFAAAQTAPAEPFARLLYRLNHAPVNLKATAESSQRGSKMQQTAGKFSQTMSPLTPALENMAKSKTLVVMSRVPLIGGSAQAARSTLGAVANINRNFARLVEFDKTRIQPLREASIAGERLQQSHDRRDLPAAVRSFEEAHRVLQDNEKLALEQRQKLTQTSDLLRRLAPYMKKSAPKSSVPAWERIQKNLTAVQIALGAQITQLSLLRRFAGDCALDGRKALNNP